MQTFENVKREFEIPKTGKAIHGAVAHVILTGDKKRAAEILRIVGGNILISGTDYTTKQAIANFYDVTNGYVAGIFQRYKISNRKYPECIVRTGVYNFEYNNKIRSGNRLKLDSGETIECATNGTMSFYDSRVVLAFACLAFMHRKIVPGSNAKMILEILKKSDYYTEAQELLKNMESHKDKPVESVALPEPVQPLSIQDSGNPDFNFKLNENGEVVISLDVLVEIIKSFIVKVAQK